jgi:hypothetical protein
MPAPLDIHSQEYRRKKLEFTLWLVAALLAFAAAIIRYVSNRTIAFPALTAGLFMLAMAFATRKKMNQTPPGGA